MKLIPALLLSTVLVTAGCKTTLSAPPANSGAVDLVDYNANLILEPAHAFALDVSNAVLSTDPNVHIELTAAQKQILITLNKSINVAAGLEKAYHASPSVAAQTALTAAANVVQSNLSSAQSVITLPAK